MSLCLQLEGSMESTWHKKNPHMISCLLVKEDFLPKSVLRHESLVEVGTKAAEHSAGPKMGI